MQAEVQIQQLNKQAMDELRYENYSEAFKLLIKAQEMLGKVNSKNLYKLQAITYNNLGCFYKATGKNEAALNYLHNALIIEKTPDFDASNLAGTHLNICAIHSQSGDHTTALTHAITALKLLKGICVDNSVKNITTLAIALHNTGIEYEAIGDIEKAAATYKYGLELAQEYLGNKHQFTTALLKSFLAITTTEKKYYFERSKNAMKTGNKKAMKSTVVGLPKVMRRTSQEFSPVFRNTKYENKEKKSLRDKREALEVYESKDKQKKFRTKMQTANEIAVRQELAMNEKPKTFDGRMKRSPHSDYVNALEEKIDFLQSQLVGFEKRYKELEEITMKKPRRFSQGDVNKKNMSNKMERINKEKAVVCIQKNWRAYLARNEVLRVREAKLRKNIEKDLEELEILKKKIMKNKFQRKHSGNNSHSPALSSERASEARRKYSLDPITETMNEAKT